MRQHLLHQRGGGAAMIGAFALDQSNRARQHGAVAGAQSARDALDVRRRRNSALCGRHHVSSSLFGRSPSKVAAPCDDKYCRNFVHGTKTV
jgi:hypothetical protein